MIFAALRQDFAETVFGDRIFTRAMLSGNL